MRHIAAWSATVNNVSDAEFAVVQDDILTQSGANRFFVPPELNNVRQAALMATTVGRGRIVTPSLEVRRSTPFITPHEPSTKLSLTLPKVYVPAKPIELVPAEEVSIKISDTGLEVAKAVIILGEKEDKPVPDGDIRRVRCTGATTVVADKWSTCVLTPDSQLEAGEYALVNAIAFSVTGVAARFIIQGQNFRDGVFAISGATELAALAYGREFERLNVPHEMGRFPHNVLPTVQMLCTAADTAQVVYLDLVKTA